MRDSKTNRSVVFRQAYWARVEELMELMDAASREKALNAARSTRLGRKAIKRMTAAAGGSAGPLTLEAVDEIAKRYGLWETRRVFDRGHYPAFVRSDTRRLDEALNSGIYELDVTLRRRVEALLRVPRPDGQAATALRSEVEASAGRLAAALDVASTAEQHHPDWADLCEEFDPICNDLDHLLTLAGAPRPEP